MGPPPPWQGMVCITLFCNIILTSFSVSLHTHNVILMSLKVQIFGDKLWVKMKN